MFPRTEVGGLSVSRLIIGSNWFLGHTHQTKSRSDMVRGTMTPEKIADVLEVFLAAGVDTIMGQGADDKLRQAIEIATQRCGREMILVSTPILNSDDGQEAIDENAGLLDAEVGYGSKICMPHMVTTDRLIDPRQRRIVHMDRYVAMIRERGMKPGLSTHRPDTPVIADESGLDVDTYIQIYNAAGFLMQIEIDWVQKCIWRSKNPVITIKPLAAGRLMPVVGLSFSWATLRPCDMITIGTYSPDEAREVIEISLAALEHRCPGVELQTTRSKKALTGE